MEVDGTPADSARTGAAAASRPLWKKALFGAVTVALVLGVLEGALWMAGAPTGAAGRDPYVGFASALPHFEVADGTVRRPDVRRSIMNPFEFPERKPDGALRVVCVGGSTTYGRPYFDDMSFAGFLRAVLPVAAPDRPVEVINAGAISYASYRVTGVMREAAQFEPDVFVVYTGHNEFLEHRTYAAIRETPGWLRDASAVVSATRIGTVVARTLTAATAGPEGIGEEVERTPANAIGPEAFHRDDAWRQTVVAEFRRALHGMVDIAERAGAHCVLVVPAANVADWSPWGSQASDALDVADVGRFLRRIDEARSAVAKGDAGTAEQAARECTEMDPRHAEAWYLLGQARRTQGRDDKAGSALHRALEEDVVPLRAIADLRDAVRAVGAERGATVVDFEPLLRTRTGKVPGDDWFADHVHPWPRASAWLAVAIAEELVRNGSLPGASWDRDLAVSRAADHLNAADAPTRARELLRLAFVLGSFDRVEAARARCERAAELLGGDARALAEAGRALARCNDLDGALDFAQRGVDADARSAGAHTRLGVVLLARGDRAAARRHLGQAIALDGDAAEARAQLGALLAGDGDLTGAEEQFREVLRLHPEKADSHYNLGLVLARRGRTVEAEQAFRDALAIDPDHPDANEQLRALSQ